MDEREFELLNILGKELGSNQRDLSRKLDLSLGLTNMIIKRLITKGYIRIEQLNKRKVQYLLTPKGFAEKIQKSIKYTLNTINSIGLIKESVRDILLKLHKDGHRKFYVYSQVDLILIMEKVFSEENLTDSSLHIVKGLNDQIIDGIFLLGYENVDVHQLNGLKYLNVLTEISKRHDFIKL